MNEDPAAAAGSFYRIVWIFLQSCITADKEFVEAASGAGSLTLSKTCRGHKALDEMLFDQHFVSASGGSQCCTFAGFLRKPCSTRFECIKHSKI